MIILLDQFMNMKPFIISIILCTFCLSLNAQSSDDLLDDLIAYNIQLNDTDKSWLKEHKSFLIDMISLAGMDDEPMNKAIVQMSIKLLSHDLIDLTDEQAKEQNVLITTIIHGALDDHNLTDEKLLSAISWYHMIKREIKL